MGSTGASRALEQRDDFPPPRRASAGVNWGRLQAIAGLLGVVTVAAGFLIHLGGDHAVISADHQELQQVELQMRSVVPGDQLARRDVTDERLRSIENELKRNREETEQVRALLLQLVNTHDGLRREATPAARRPIRIIPVEVP